MSILLSALFSSLVTLPFQHKSENASSCFLHNFLLIQLMYPAPFLIRHHTLAQKSFVRALHVNAASCKKIHVYIYVRSYVEALLFPDAAVATVMFLPPFFANIKNFFSPSLFSDDKKAVLHSTFYPFL